MSIFGKKGNDAQEDAGLTLDEPAFEDPALDDPMLEDPSRPPAGLEDPSAAASSAGDDFGDFDEQLDDPLAGGDGGDGLAAPSRKMASAGGGRRNLLVLLLLLVLAAGGGGYFYFMGEMAEPVTPTLVKADVPPMNTPVTQPPAHDPLAANPAGTMPQPLPGDEVASIEAPENPFAAPAPGADPLAASDPLAADPLGADPFAAADPLAAAPAPDAAATTGQEDPFGLGAPPEDETAAALPVEDMMAQTGDPALEAPAMETPALPGDVPADDLPMPDATAAAPEEMPAPNDVAEAFSAAPGDDLPMPADAMTAQPPVAAATGEEPPAWAAPGSAEIPGTTNPLAKPTTPTDAELAIVQSAAVLDNMDAPKTATGAAKEETSKDKTAESTGAPFDPAGPKPGAKDAMKTVDEILVKPAVVRPLPSGYMTIRRDSDSGDVDSRLTAARTALAQNRTPAALELFEDLKKDFPKDKRALMGRAVSLQKLRQYDEALAAYEEVLINDPKNLDALTNMLGLLKVKDPNLAVDKLLDLRNAYPYHADVTAQLGIAYATTGQYDEALKYLEMADALKPGSSFVMYNKAVLYDKMGKNREAGLLYRQILRMAADGELDQQLPLESIRKRLAVLR